ncbi:hypothetical protein CVS40_12818 [Lucilia cuprina]|nr:hypothetical protein CVS40_12818 [Lucilia cuprina]
MLLQIQAKCNNGFMDPNVSERDLKERRVRPKKDGTNSSNRHQQLEQLRSAYLELQQQQQPQQHQQYNQLDRILKNVSYLPVFTGVGDITINSFLSSAEYLLTTIGEESLKKEAIKAIVINVQQPDNWTIIKKTLKLRYRPDVEPHQIYRRINELRVNNIWMMIILVIIMLTPMSKGTITTKQLTEQSGFIDIFIKNREIVKELDIILHIINLQEIEHILDQMTENVILIKTKNKEILQLELLEARNKLITLKPKQIRQRRGLINGIGIKLRSIVPIPNNESNEIDYSIEMIFEFDNKIFKFEEHKYLKDLK